MADISDLGNIVTDVGSAVGDLFGSEGNAAEANSFESAATLAEQNAQLTAASTRIQETQTARQVFQTEGTQTADVAGAGFTESGSALDLLKSTMSQGALAKSLVNIQGAINENSYAAQAGAYEGEAAKANEASNAGLVSAIGAVGGALLSGAKLAGAGNTVAKLFTSDEGTVSGSAVASDPAITVGADGLGSAGVAPTTGSTLSATDTSIGQGADLSGYLSPSSTVTAPIDSSAIPIGTTAEAAEQGTADAAANAGEAAAEDAGSAAAEDAGEAAATDAGEAAAEDAGEAAAEDAGEAAAEDAAADAAASDGIGDVIGGVVDAVASISIICGVLYKVGLIERRVYAGDLRFGDLWSRELFEAYWWWGTPIARGIERSKIFAAIAAPFFVPIALEMAFKTHHYPKSTLRGRVFLKMMELFTKAIVWGGLNVRAKA